MKILGYLGLGMMAVLLSAGLFTLFAPQFGWRIDTVLSGSMEPKMGIGSVVVTRPMPTQEIKIGDVITFHSPLTGNLTTHRVVAEVQGEVHGFRTKGDANEDADPFVVPAENVVGKVSLNIPYFGYAAQFVKTRWGTLLTLFVPGLVIIGMEIRNMWRELSRQETEKKYRVAR